MPESQRKSSVGTSRRGPPKAHVPYRGDNPEVAKKTGVRILHADPGSDGFEPFDHVVQQADKLTPYHVKGRKNKEGDGQEESESDEDGMSDMEIDSPIHYIANSRQPPSPTFTRVGSMSRPVARNPTDEFDSLPSPRSPNRSRASTFISRPSRLSQRLPASDDYTEVNTTNGYQDMELDSGYDPAQHRSFSELDGMDDDEGDSPEESPPKLNGKGKKAAHRAPSPEGRPDMQGFEMEDDIQQGLDDLDGQRIDDGPEEEEEPLKKARFDKGKEPETRKARGKGQARKKDYREGVRKSQRKPIKPLEWWRNEKYVYERPKSGGTLVPHIKEIIRIPEEPKEPLVGKHKRKRGKSVPGNPEYGWDDATETSGVVWNWSTAGEVERRIAHLAKDVNPQPSANNDWYFQRIFADEDFIAAGQLLIPVRGRKASKTTKDNTYIFYIIEGAINLKIHETSMILCTGAMFMVPRGNQYFIENISDRDVKLFFTQARKAPFEDGSVARKAPPSRSSSAVVPHKSQAPDSARRTVTTEV